MSVENSLLAPVQALYELYLEHAKPDPRRKQGAYATPPQVVSYVVRSIQDLLVTGFGRTLGLADPDVRLLDPAAGPLNFVLAACREAIDCHRRHHGPDGVDDLLRDHLLPHFQGIELQPWPHALGTLALELFLMAQGYRRGPGEAMRFARGDALAAPPRLVRDPADREGQRIAVVLGNPPYGAGPAPTGRWIERLLADYTRIDGAPLRERNPKWLKDASLRFLRLAQWTVEETGAGIAGLVLPHTLVDAPTFRGVRQSLLQAFDEIYMLDLHGNQRKRETGPQGEPDENVFSGVAIGIAVVLLVKLPATTAEKNPLEVAP